MSIASKAARLLGLVLFAMLLGARAYAADPVFVVVGSCSTLFNCYPGHIVLKQPSAVADTDKLLVCNRQEPTGKGSMGNCGNAGQVTIKAKSTIASTALIGVCFGGTSSSTAASCDEYDNANTPADQEGWNVASVVFGAGTPTQPQPPTNPSFPGEALLTWIAPFMNTDGTSLTNLAGFRVYYGISASTLSQTVQIPGPTATFYNITGLGAGTWYFAVSAYATNGSESTRSAVVLKTVSGTPPVGTPPPAENGQLCLVDGSSTGSRPVYASSADGRGAQVGDLLVGPTSQPAGTANPVTRARCSCVDLKNWSGVIYSKVASPAGYVSSCKNYGTP